MDGSFKPFRFWCQHVLPQVYDDSLSYMELLNKVIVYINSFGEYLEEFTAINEVKYGGPWDVTKQYTPNTVVSVGDTGYMSIKPVPAGIDISNTDYWLKVADFAGQVVDLGIRVIALEGKMAQAESDIVTLTEGLSGANTEIAGIKLVNTAQGNAISAIDGILADNQLRSAKYAIWIGDSYTGASSLGDDIDKRFSTLVSGWLNLTEKNYAVGGNGVLIGEHNYPSQLEDAVTDFNTNNLNKEDVKYVFISSCRNDTNYGTRGQMRTAIGDMVQSINTNFPNAHIYITPLLWDWKTVYFNSRLLDYISEMQFAGHYGKRVHIINYGYEWLMGRPDSILWQNGGDVHPTVFGHKIIADHIYSAVCGEDWRRYEFAQVNPTTLNGIGDFSGFYEVMDGYVNLNFQFTVNGGSDISSGTLWNLAINNPYFSSFFITDAGSSGDLYFDIVSRDLAGYVNQPVCKAFLRNSCSKSDTTTASYLLECKLYGNGNLVNTHKYYARLRIPYGRRNYPTFS